MHRDIKTGNYVNRDLSWVEFNRRVLQEAQDSTTPLLERLRFLGIVASNLDEFMSVRVAETKEKIKAGFTQKDFSGYTPSGLYRRLIKRTGAMVAEQYKTYRELIRLLAKRELFYKSITSLMEHSNGQWINIFMILFSLY